VGDPYLRQLNMKLRPRIHATLPNACTAWPWPNATVKDTYVSSPNTPNYAEVLAF